MLLNPCPFCGGEAQRIGDDIEEAEIFCKKCSAMMESDGFETEQQFYARWNSRVERET